jgi:hypothetical protein
MLEPEEIDEIEEIARPLINGGFTTRDDVIEGAVEYFEDDFELDEEDLTAVVDRLWRERVAEQAGWPAETEAERVLRTLASLSVRGIVARANFTCCNNCGATEIRDEASEGDHGYVFFHQQDTEAAARDGSLYLSYGSFDGTDPTTIGLAVAAALTEAGVRTVWDGSVRKRILVNLSAWQLRLA